jgi:hypothetical protein
MRKGGPPASAARQPALGGGHWKLPLGKQLPPSEPPPELEPGPDEEVELEPPPPELDPEPDEEPVLPELAPCPLLEVLLQARWPVARVAAAMARSEVTVRTGEPPVFDPA